MEEEWFSLEDVQPSDNTDRLYCISVDSPERQFLAGKIGFPTHNSEQGKAEDELKGEAAMIIGSIARLGRAAGVHLVIATQRPDAKIISGETKANLGVRINCGRTDSNASSMILGNGEGTQVKSNPQGRLYLRIFANGDHGQGFFASPSWIDEYLASQGKNPDGSPINTTPRSKLANVTDMSQFDGADLDSREGIDNSAVIEKIREEESNREYSDEELDALLAEDEEENDDWDDEEEDTPPTDRPVFEDKTTEGNPWDRPEDDWSSELEDLINENFEK